MQSNHIVMFFNMQFFSPFVVLKAPCLSTLTHGTILVNIGLFAAWHSLQYGNTGCGVFKQGTKLFTPSTLNIDRILWHTQLIVCAENVKLWFKSWVFPFIFQAYILPHTLNCMCVSLFKFHI